ncbi:hypothetical protein ACFL9T_12275 [Thermodesulfobacteriota bacterium]
MSASEYNRDQLEALLMAQGYLGKLSPARLGEFKQQMGSYIRFREDVAQFHAQHFSSVCSRKCFLSHTSACCSREGIATFFADILINTALSSNDELESLLLALSEDRGGFKCVYLTETGCLWRLKPIVCAMFLCKSAQESVLGTDRDLKSRWDHLKLREKAYTWPDRPVLFDELEAICLEAGFDSPLMYFHRSPGLQRVKAQSRKRPLPAHR